MARKKLGELLRESGAIDELQLQSALGHQRQWGGRLGRILVQLGFATDEQIADVIAGQLGIPSVRLLGRAIEPEVLASLPAEICERNQLVPYARTRAERGADVLHVAMADPTDLAVVDELSFRTGKRIDVAAAPDRDVELAIRHHFHGEAVADQLRAPTDTSDAAFGGREVELPEDPSSPGLAAEAGALPGAPALPAPVAAWPVPEGADPQAIAAAQTAYLAQLQAAQLQAAQYQLAYAAAFNALPRAQAPNAPPPPPAASGGPPPLTLRERLLLETIEAVVNDDGEPLPPRQLVAALVRLLIRQGVVREEDFVAELSRK